MNYLFLAYADTSQFESATSGEREAYAAFQASESTLRQGGYLVAGACLPGSDTPLRLRVRDGRLSLRIRPSPANGQLVALFLITARDLNEAIRVAANLPQAQKGVIEVRSV